MHEAARGVAVKGDISEVGYGLVKSPVGHGAGEPPTTQNGDCFNINKIGCRQFSVFSQEVAGLITCSFIVADCIGQDRGIDNDHSAARSASRSSEA